MAKRESPAGGFGQGAISVPDLAALLGITQEGLVRVLRSGGVRTRRGRGATRIVGWLAASQRINPRDVAAERKAARARGFKVRRSRWTLAGYPELVAQSLMVEVPGGRRPRMAILALRPRSFRLGAARFASPWPHASPTRPLSGTRPRTVG